MAATAMQKIEGPRLTDLSVTVADYGTPLNYFYGVRRLEVPCFYAEPIKERKKKRKTKGGKYKDYTYYGTWAVAVADHEIDAIRRIWFDRHLVYDINGAGATSIFALAEGYELENSVVFYYGTEAQLPHERMIATVEADEGPDTCPAYRGVAYIFFIDIPLEKLGNRYPQVSVEGVNTGGQLYPDDIAFPNDPFPFENFPISIAPAQSLDGFIFSPDGARFVWNNGNNFEVWAVASRTLISQGTFPADIGTVQTTLGMDSDYNIYAVRSSSSPFDPGEVRVFAPNGLSIIKTVNLESRASYCQIIASGGDEYCCVSGFNPGITVDNQYFKTTDGLITKIDTSYPTVQYCADTDGNIWAFGNGFSSNDLYFECIIGDRLSDYATLTSAKASPSDRPCVMHNGAGQFFVVDGDIAMLIDDQTFAIVDSETISVSGADKVKQMINAHPGDETIWFGPIETSTRDFSVIRSVNPSDWIAQDADGIIYNGLINALITFPQFDFDMNILYLDRGLGERPFLSDIIEDVSARAGISSDDFEASDCNQFVEGYSWTQGTGKDILGPLLDIYDVDARANDFGIEFLKRGMAIGSVIANPEFAVSGDDGDRYSLTLRADNDLPRRMFFSFADTDAEQQPNSVVCQRKAGAINSARDISIDMTTLAMDPSRASDLANRMFRRIHFAREKAEFGLTAQRLGLQCADVHTIDFDGNQIGMRLTRFAKGAGGIISTDWERDHPSLALLPGMTGAVASGRPPSVIYAPGPSQGFFLDIALLDDSHDLATPFIYLAAGTVDEDNFWPGADISQSDSGLVAEFTAGWDAFLSSEGCTHGSVLSPLPDALTSVIDYGTSVQIQLLAGELQSYTETQILTDASLNLALIGGEMVQFITATLIGTKLYQVSGFVRGARGTERMTGTHDYIEDFLLLDSAIKRHTLGASEIGDTDYYAAASLGNNIDEGDIVAVEFSAAANKPYSPAHLAATYDDYSGEWTLSWIRRSRIGGSTLNGQNVPLGETAESYKLQILNGDAAVLRTIEQSANSYVYGVAEQIADFGAPQTSFAYKVAQQSPTLGLDGYFSTASAEI
jgi:hypothetical protein